jgi:GTPase SAR1 family protein
MRIVMLGYSDAGKTTYMAMMYRFMNKAKGHNGFRIEADNRQQGIKLLENAESISHGWYPDPTDRRDSYHFSLYFQGQRISTFEWADYRGGALTERSTNEDMAALLADMKSCDAIVVFADAYELATVPDSHRRVRRLTVLMQQAISAQRSAIPIVLAYTKADLIRKSEQWRVAIEPFEQVSRALETSANVKGAIVTVSCGKRLKAVHVPVLWCLSQGVANTIRALQDDVNYYTRQADSHGERGSIGNSIKSMWNGVDSEWKKQRLYLKEAEDKLAEIQPLLLPADRLRGTLEKAQRKDGPPRAYRRAARH